MSYDVPSSFVGEGLITEVLHVVKSGKEATVYCCAAGPAISAEFAAVKVYRPVTERSFKNDALYWEGRNVGGAGRPDRRARKSVAARSNHGRLIQMGTWASDEYRTLDTLWRAGASVPRPYGQKLPSPISPSTALCLEYLGDADGAAPKLSEVTLTPRQAECAFRRLIDDVTTFLAVDRVHGDLSAYNVLYWQGKPVVIDFPQAVDPMANPNALLLLERDVTNLCDYFADYGIRTDGARLAHSLWHRYWRREL
jgi:RIO kinase 1